MEHSTQEALQLAFETQRAAYAREPMPGLAVRRDRLQRLVGGDQPFLDHVAASDLYPISAADRALGRITASLNGDISFSSTINGARAFVTRRVAMTLTS